MDKQLFNDLCHVVIYHFCDVCHKAGSERSRAAKRLVERGIMSDTGDGEGAYAKYEEMVVEYGLDALNADLPENYHRGHDYWGAVCLMLPDDSTKDTSLPFAGDSCGRIMLFANFDALGQYTKEVVDERHHAYYHG